MSPEVIVQAAGEPAIAAAGTLAWWIWPALLFVVSFVLGLVAVQAGVGGGVLYVPIVSSFFPFHLDFVRAAGLMIALASSLAAAPTLLRMNLASLRLALPAALIASIFSIAGASIGMALPSHIVQTALGVAILAIAMLFLFSRSAAGVRSPAPDRLARLLGIRGSYWEAAEGVRVDWTVHRTGFGLMTFSLIGFMAGLFGLGAGWANVPVLNLLMGAPLKVAVGTSVLLLSATDTTAVWVYIHRGALLPVIAIPSVLGMMLGAWIGVRLLARARPRSIRWIVIVMLMLAGLRSIVKGIAGFGG